MDLKRKRLLLILSPILLLSGCVAVRKATTESPTPFSFKKISTLDQRYTETSGLAIYNDQLIIHNDSGDEPTLYFLDTLGSGKSQTRFNNMSAVDWEDITIDAGHAYIADIGNNYGNRKDLTIYKIKLGDLHVSDAFVDTIHINYPAQKNFVHELQSHPYDAESVVAIGEYLYVFSKDWKDLTTVIYRLDKNTPKQSAVKVQSHPVRGLITGATFNGTDKVMLCGYTSLLEPFIVQVDYAGGKFRFREKQMLPLTDGAQIEAITYISTDDAGNEMYYLSSEAARIKLGDDEAKSDAQLYKLVIPTR